LSLKLFVGSDLLRECLYQAAIGVVLQQGDPRQGKGEDDDRRDGLERNSLR
jgi:hypothetical protein